MISFTILAIGLVLGQVSKVAANVQSERNAGLPAAWHGVWKGRCRSETPTTSSQDFAMELHIAPLKAGKLSWQITYGEGAKRQVRPYELTPDPMVPGKFVIDEKNGILLDCQLFGNVLFCQFLVDGNLISSREELTTDGIRVELTTFDQAKPRNSNAGAFQVKSYPAKAVQRGLLKRAVTDPKGP